MAYILQIKDGNLFGQVSILTVIIISRSQVTIVLYTSLENNTIEARIQQQVKEISVLENDPVWIILRFIINAYQLKIFLIKLYL